jgi:ATP-dependent RNA helicase RhlE
MDFLQEGALRLGGLKILILDEVDRMLDMGFIHDVKRIIQRCPPQRQTLFFSATVPPEIAAVASFALKDPARIEIGVARAVTTSVQHAIYPVSAEQKFELLQALLEKIDFNSVLIFSRTKHGPGGCGRRTTPWGCCTPTAPRTSGSRPSRASAAVAMRSWSRRTSPRAASTWPGCPM